MSGLEVAGVVLGALPLVFETLEHYSKGANLVRMQPRFLTRLNSYMCR
jgi:hypothetical protein